MKHFNRLSGLGLLLIVFVTQAQVDKQVLPAEEFKSMRAAHSEWQLVDVRTPEEFSKDHIQNALNVDFSGRTFKEQVDALDKNVPVMVYCLSGGRSAKAATYMREKGLVVYELKGGMMQWKVNNFPIESSRPVLEGLSLEEYKNQTSGKLVLVDFYAPWCAPCKKMAPELAAISAEHKEHFSLLKINVDENNTVVREMKIDALPVIMLYKDGKVIWSANHYVGKADLLKILREHF